jgi:hypothetical protein
MTETVLIQQNIALVLSEIPKETTFQSQLEKRASTPELSREKLSELYLETLTPKERKSYLIAKEHLGMSFTLEKSVGFLKWKKSTL